MWLRQIASRVGYSTSVARVRKPLVWRIGQIKKTVDPELRRHRGMTDMEFSWQWWIVYQKFLQNGRMIFFRLLSSTLDHGSIRIQWAGRHPVWRAEWQLDFCFIVDYNYMRIRLVIGIAQTLLAVLRNSGGMSRMMVWCAMGVVHVLGCDE